MTQYYFAATALPPLQLNAPPEVSFEAVMFVLSINLERHDWDTIRQFRLFYDIQNLKALWRHLPIQPYGNLNLPELEEAVRDGIGLPDYVFDFTNRYDGPKARLHHFPELMVTYFRRTIAKSTGFLRRYLQFEWEWHLVAVALRAKALGRDLAEELQYEDPDDDFVAQLLVQKDAPTFEPPEDYEMVKALFERHVDDPLALHMALSAYRFDKIEEMLGIDLFSIDRIVGYVAQLIALEQIFGLDRQRGIEFVAALKEQPL